MKLNYNLLSLILLFQLAASGQVGIGTTVPNAALDINSSTNGLLIPRIALTSKAVAAPVVNPQGGVLTAGTLVWNTATTGTSPNNVIPGFYYWSGTAWTAFTGLNGNNWTILGNTGTTGGNTTTAGTNFIGTTDAQNLDFRANNAFVGRFTPAGEFFVGTLSTTLAGDLMNGVGKSAYPWALNGYTAYVGAGVYGQRMTGSTGTWGGVQGELASTVPSGSSGIYGVVINTAHNGVLGSKPSGGLGYGGLFYNDLGYSGGFYTVSDRRLKKNIQPLQNVLETLKSIPFYTYNFKTEDYDILGGEELHYGVMSDELKGIIPSLVKAKNFISGDVKTLRDGKQQRGIDFEVNAVNYLELIPLAIQGIKEQQTIIEEQNKRIERLEKIILELQEKK